MGSMQPALGIGLTQTTEGLPVQLRPQPPGEPLYTPGPHLR